MPFKRQTASLLAKPCLTTPLRNFQPQKHIFLRLLAKHLHEFPFFMFDLNVLRHESSDEERLRHY
jgi:hypothetical protein